MSSQDPPGNGADLNLPSSNGPYWPDSEGARHVRAYVDALAEPDPERVRTLIENHLAPGTTTTLDDEVRQHTEAREQLGAYRPEEVVQRTAEAISVAGLAGNLRQWMRLDFVLEAEAPHRIMRMHGGLTVRPGTVLDLSAKMRLEEMVARTREAAGAPGIAVTILRQGVLLQNAVAGLRVEGGVEPVQPDDRFHLGSLAKSMTATVLAYLVEQGLLSWSTLMADLLPELDPSGRFPGVTLAHLLHHRAGLEPFTSDDEFPAAEIAARPVPVQEKRRAVAAEALRREPRSSPGVTMSYSNAGYVIAALMAEVVTGEAWEGLLRAHLFEPWGLTSFGLGWPVTAERTEGPRGHVGLPDAYRVQQPGELPTYVLQRGAGEVHGSMADLARYGAGHIEGLRTRAPTLTRETVEWLHARPHGVNECAWYAAGWDVRRTPSGVRQHSHNGSTGTYYAHLSLFPDHGLVVAAAVNCGVHAMPALDGLVGALAPISGEDDDARQT